MSTLEANIRNNKTSGDLKIIRQQGNVPGIVYGGSKKPKCICVYKSTKKFNGARKLSFENYKA